MSGTVKAKRRIVREKGKKMQVLEFEIPESDDAMFYRAMGLKMAKGGRSNPRDSIPLSPLDNERVDDFLENELFPHLLQTAKNAGKNEALDETIPIIEKTEKELNETNTSKVFLFDARINTKPCKGTDGALPIGEIAE